MSQKNMDRKILVTGGAGYIGSHTTVELQQKGYQVVIADNFCTSKPLIIGQIEKISGVRPLIEELDLCDAAATNELFGKHKFDAVIHFAAHKAVGESVQQPLKYYHNNLLSLINVANACLQHEVSTFVFSSSCTVYGEPDVLPVSEATPVKAALSPYGNTKQVCEEMLHDSTKVSQLQVISLRYFNPVGAHPTALIGELPVGVPNNLVPFITQVAAGKRAELTVFGNDYPTPDGTCVRDYIHVVDLAKAHAAAIARLFNKKNTSSFEVFNIGAGKGYSVLQCIQAFEKASGVKLNYKFAGRRPGDVPEIYADTTYANNSLDWKAQLTLDEMMRSAWNWEKYLIELKL